MSVFEINSLQEQTKLDTKTLQSVLSGSLCWHQKHISNTLFSTVQLPTIPVNSSYDIYANTGLPTIPFDSSVRAFKSPSSAEGFDTRSEEAAPAAI